MSDQFQWWRLALAGKKPEIHADNPQPGYYKMRNGKDGPFVPVAIWHNAEGTLVCRVANETRAPLDVWTYCAGNPVAKDAAKQAFETGAWPGDVPAIGHNSGSLDLFDEIAEARTQALGWLSKTGITDKTSMDMAANYRAKLLELSKRADAEREEKVRPHIYSQKAINAKYKPMVDSSKAAADTIRDALSKYMAAEEEKERARVAEAARVENEKRQAEFKRQQEEAAAKAAAAPYKEPPPPIEAPTFVAPEPVRLQAGGQRGKKASLRDVKRFAISDYAAALAHSKDHPDVMAAVEKVCFAQARAGATVPGVTTTIEQVAV